MVPFEGTGNQGAIFLIRFWKSTFINEKEKMEVSIDTNSLQC
jgi:hypothetical protein